MKNKLKVKGQKTVFEPFERKTITLTISQDDFQCHVGHIIEIAGNGQYKVIKIEGNSVICEPSNIPYAKKPHIWKRLIKWCKRKFI